MDLNQDSDVDQDWPTQVAESSQAAGKAAGTAQAAAQKAATASGMAMA
jgi:hypothetical protein